MARRGRKPKSKDQKLKDALERNQPADYILERRKLFSFVQPDKRLDGRNGEIDSEVCDAIGQMCALGLLDGNGYDPIELRDKGRFWGGHYAKLFKGMAAKTGSYERKDRSTPSGALTGEDLLFDRMDETLDEYDRRVLLTLVVDPLIGHEEHVWWAKTLIDDGLFRRGRFYSGQVIGMVTDTERAYRDAVVRALCCLTEGSLPGRYERRAA
jgi:hypothetical protein